MQNPTKIESLKVNELPVLEIKDWRSLRSRELQIVILVFFHCHIQRLVVSFPLSFTHALILFLFWAVVQLVCYTAIFSVVTQRSSS